MTSCQVQKIIRYVNDNENITIFFNKLAVLILFDKSILVFFQQQEYSFLCNDDTILLKK